MNVAPEVLDESQAIVVLSDIYDGEECGYALSAARMNGIFTDEIALQGSIMKVCVRAHQMSVNEPVSYTITIR